MILQYYGYSKYPQHVGVTILNMLTRAISRQ